MSRLRTIWHSDEFGIAALFVMTISAVMCAVMVLNFVFNFLFHH